MKQVKVKANNLFSDADSKTLRVTGEEFIVSEERYKTINNTKPSLLTFVEEIEDVEDIEEDKKQEKEKKKPAGKKKKDDA